MFKIRCTPIQRLYFAKNFGKNGLAMSGENFYGEYCEAWNFTVVEVASRRPNMDVNNNLTVWTAFLCIKNVHNKYILVPIKIKFYHLWCI